MATSRSNHTATALVDGRVLVAGGDADLPTPKTSSSELFDPAASCGSGCNGAWNPGGPLSIARSRHSATLLYPPLCHQEGVPPDYPCGKVLVTAGDEQPGLRFVPDQPNPPDDVPLPESSDTWVPRSTAELYDPDTDSWQTCPVTTPSSSCPGPLIESRGAHSATLLLDGRVLVVSAQSAELYDPRTGIWSAAATPNRPRDQFHSATLLDSDGCNQGGPATVYPCGKVLVIGGDSDPLLPSTAEIYDPIENTWTLTGELASYRRDHSTTVLSNGDVLVVGGSQNASAERYDALSGTWTGIADLEAARWGHRAVRLQDGTVLVVGGRQTADIGGMTASAIIFQPDDGRWHGTSAMADAREAHALAALPTGDVLVTGGVGGGPGQQVRLASAELYRPVEPPAAPVVDAISPTRGPTSGGTRVTITGARLAHATDVVFGETSAVAMQVVSDTQLVVESPPGSPGSVDVLVRNGAGLSNPVAAGRFTYLRGVGLWSPTGSSLSGSAGQTATLLNTGKVLVTGGTPRADRQVAERGQAELFDPMAGTWAYTGFRASDRTYHTATLLHNGKVLVAGGASDGEGSSSELYDPSGIGVYPEIDGLLKVQRGYNVTTGGWTPAASMASPRQHHTATLLPDGTVLVVGGDLLGTAERYDPVPEPVGSWLRATPPGVARYSHTATLLDDDRVLVVGGCGDASCSAVPLGSAQVFDPAKGTWTPTGSLNVARSRHTAVRLGDGRVLVAGGCTHATCDAATSTAEIYDPAEGVWRSVEPMSDARHSHTASVLASGKVLVAGGGGTSIPFRATAELFDPASGSWRPAGRVTPGLRHLTPRSGHTAVVLPDGPASACGTNCGKVLVGGGCCGGDGGAGLNASELFAPPPEVVAVAPAAGLTVGGTRVTIEGSGLNGASAVGFGPFAATEVTPDPDRPATRLTAVSPKHRAGPADVVVATTPVAGYAPLESAPGPGARFNYLVPDRPLDLVATAVSETEIRLDFIAPDDPTATRYVVKQAATPIDSEPAFDSAASLCGGVCELPAGDRLSLTVGGLVPGTTYHFALRAVRPGGDTGPPSASVSATTLGVAPPPLPPMERACAALGETPPGSVAYPAGYSLVGVPAGTVVGSRSPLYGWLDLGAGGAYSTRAAGDPAEGGRGYWAYFSCPKLLGPLGPGEASVRLPLGAYRASMVGNPSGREPVAMSGHDYAARWDPSLNGGAGGYRLSGYRQAETLGVGQGAWAFSYTDTVIQLGR